MCVCTSGCWDPKHSEGAWAWLNSGSSELEPCGSFSLRPALGDTVGANRHVKVSVFSFLTKRASESMQDHQEWPSFSPPNVKLINSVIFEVLSFFSEFSGNRRLCACKVPKLFTVSLEQESIYFHLPSPWKHFEATKKSLKSLICFLKKITLIQPTELS